MSKPSMTDRVKSIYDHASGVRAVLMVIIMLAGFIGSWYATKYEIAKAQDDATEAKGQANINNDDLQQVKSDIRLINQRDEQTSKKIEKLESRSEKQTILLERIATRLQVETQDLQ